MDQLPNIRQLAAFVATVQEGTVTAAAERVGLTQPALTQSIAGLERALDCQLFERGSSGMLATNPATLLAPRAARALSLIGSNRVTATQMRAFLALANAGSYSAASVDSGASSASLHRAIADLSIALGETLVERRGRHLALTRRGERRARNFGLAAAEIRNGLAELNLWLGRAGARVVVGAMPLSRADWLPRSILKLRALHPMVDIAVVEGSHSELVGPLRTGEIDFLLGALRRPEELDDLEQEPVFEDRPAIIMRSDHPLASYDKLAGEALLDFPWVLPPEPTPLRIYWREMMASSGVEPPAVPIECGSGLTIRELLLGSDMLSLLSPAQMRVELASGALRAMPPPKEIKRTIGITTRPDWRPTPAQGDLLEDLRNYPT